MYHSNARLDRVFLHVFVKRHGFEHDFLVDAAGIEQMQFAVLPPNSKAYVTYIQAFLVGRDGDDIAVLDAAEHLLAVPYSFLWNITDSCS